MSRAWQPAVVLIVLGALLACGGSLSRPIATTASPSREPRPTCRGPFTCDGETNVCRRTGDGITGSFTFDDDSKYTVRSDGRGPYEHGRDGAGVFAGIAAVLYWRTPPADTASARFITVDLNRPVAGDIGRPLGVVRDSYAEVAAQWYAEPATDSSGKPVRIQHTMLELPVGLTVEARQVNIGVHIDGRYHILQMGPQPTSHCFVEGTAINGEGTTVARISRPSEHTFVVEAPPGSIGRLFDTYHTSKYAVNRGLYHVAFKYIIRK